MDWSLRKYAKADAITSSLENTAGTAVVKVNSRVRQVTVSYAPFIPFFSGVSSGVLFHRSWIL